MIENYEKVFILSFKQLLKNCTYRQRVVYRKDLGVQTAYLLLEQKTKVSHMVVHNHLYLQLHGQAHAHMWCTYMLSTYIQAKPHAHKIMNK